MNSSEYDLLQYLRNKSSADQKNYFWRLGFRSNIFSSLLQQETSADSVERVVVFPVSSASEIHRERLAFQPLRREAGEEDVLLPRQLAARACRTEC